jgi:16S rRNA (uracil1498-N3)-methyltransferase
MRITRIYTSQPLTVGQQLALDNNASRHLVTVLRTKCGAPVILFNGQGGEFIGSLIDAHPKKALISIEHFNDIDRESPLKIHLGIAISRGDRFDFVLQKATELGVSDITPLFAERSEVKLKADRLEKKRRHWQQITISACEQSQRNKLPTLHQACTLNDWITTTDAEQKLVLHHRSDQKLSDYQQPESLALLIGPEGGLSTAEIGLAHYYEFDNLTLGPRVLRTETAPLTAISLVQFLWGDL